MWSITGGHRLRVSSASTFESVLASVSSRCRRFSASASAARAVSSSARAALWAASAATAAASASVSAACAPSTAAASGALAPPCRVASSRSIAAISPAMRAVRSSCSRAAFSKLIALRRQVGERRGELGENLFGGGKLAVGLRDLGVDAAAAAGALAAPRVGSSLPRRPAARARLRRRRRACASRSMSAANCTSRSSSSAMRSLARCFFAVEFLLRDIEPVQRGAGARLGFAQFRQRGRRQAPGAWTLPPARRCARRPRARRRPWRVRPRSPRLFAAVQRRWIERGLRLAHLRRHGAVADRLPGLLLQAVDLARRAGR